MVKTGEGRGMTHVGKGACLSPECVCVSGKESVGDKTHSGHKRGGGAHIPLPGSCFPVSGVCVLCVTDYPIGSSPPGSKGKVSKCGSWKLTRLPGMSYCHFPQDSNFTYLSYIYESSIRLLFFL